MYVDFHMHSTFSDGVETPQALLSHAREKGLTYMALTDHDEINGVKELLAIPQQDVHVISGCEFSAAFHGKDVHILGYDFDVNHRGLNDFIDYFKQKRWDRIVEIIARCNEAGYAISMEQLEADFPNTKAYGRPHVAHLLIEKGYVRDLGEAFATVLSAKSSCYVPKVKVQPFEVVHMIHEAGGLAVLAHPLLVRSDDDVETLLALPFDGVEVYHSKQGPQEEEIYRHMAEQRHLLITGGSDYHGIAGRYPYYLGEYVVTQNKVQSFIDAIEAK